MSDKKKSGTRGRWFKRVFFGGSRVMADELEKKDIGTEEIVSPLKRIVRDFMARKLAIAAFIVVILMFLTVFIGPLFMTNYRDAYEEITQQNVAPTMALMDMPSGLKNDIKSIDAYGPFSVGLSNSGEVFVWGHTKIGTTGIDVANIPEEVKASKIAYAAAGIDHVLAITEEGKVLCWGLPTRGQFRTGIEADELSQSEDPTILMMPDEIFTGTLDVSQIKKVTCGYQSSAILMNDGTLYLWGNTLSYNNLETISVMSNLVDIDFSLNYVFGVDKKGTSIVSGKRAFYDKFRSNMDQKSYSAKEYLDGRKIVSIAASSNSITGLLDDGSVFLAGDPAANSTPIPPLQAGETFVSISAGAHHFSGLTSKGRVLSWGENTHGQTELPEALPAAGSVYACSFQNYAVDPDGKLLNSWGLRGYIFGTDKNGAEIFARIIQGGKMTMTIGAVAVVISTIIGIIIGCVSGYFGGKVDMILMRVTEIFAAIPFLPFALILSAVMSQMPISENQKIMILMVILGILTWTGLARMVRGQVLAARENEYVTAAKAMGVREGRIAFKHILPNVVSIIFVSLTLDFATCMLTESSLSYLGFGVTFPRPTWGNMLNGANNATIIKNFWWQWLFPSLFLAITCICINIVGDTLRDVMDPKSDRDK